MSIDSKVAIFSDLHLGIYGNSELWHKIALYWANWIVKELKSKDIKTIFFLGDFFHNRTEISVQTLHVASQVLEIFKDFDITMIVGNHDAFYKHRSDVHSLGLLHGHENVSIVDKTTILELCGKQLLFVPWNAPLPDGKFDHIFGHFEIQNFQMNNYKVCDKGLSSTDFLSGRTNSVFSGHFHHRNTRSYNEGKIHYVGNTFGMDFSDVDNEKGYYILDLDTGDLEFFKNTASPKFKKIILSKLKSYPKTEFFRNHVKLIADMEMSEAQFEKIRAYIMAGKPFQFSVEFNIKSTGNYDKVEDVDSVDIWEQVVEYMTNMKLPSEKNEKVLEMMKELYERNK